MRTYKLALVLAVALGGSISAADWPQWRGPRGTGASDEKNLPVKWSATENVAWKAPIGGVGVSSPIVSGSRVFVTSQIGTGVRRAGNHPRLAQGANAGVAGERALVAAAPADDRTFFVVEAFNRTDGRRLWQHRVEATGTLPGVHDKHNLASPSPVTDGQMVYAWFGTGQIVALDMSGKVAWERHLGKEIAPFEINWGHSSSPTLYGDTLLLLCDHTPASYLLAVDKKTGKERWKTDRGKGRMSYTTPFVVETPSGPELIVNSSQRVDAYDPRTGAFLWHVGGSNQFPIPAPTFHDGVLYMTRGYRSGPYMAIRPGGRGDIGSSHVVWEVRDRRALHLVARLRRGHSLHGERRRRGHGDRRGHGHAHLAAAGGRHLLGVAGGGRRQDLLRQRDRRDHRAEGGPPARGPRAQRSGRAPDRVAGDLEWTALHSLRRPIVRDRKKVIDPISSTPPSSSRPR